jgi:PAS domain S-box-containing protein
VSDQDSLKARIAELELQLEAQRKTNAVLMRRVEHSVSLEGGAYSLFAQNSLLQQSVQLRTREIEETNQQLRAEVDERRAAEQALQESQMLLEQAQEMGGVGSWAVDLQTGRILWSKHAFRMYGLDPATTAPSLEAFLSVIHPDDLARITEITGGAPTGSGHDMEFRIVRPNGEVRWIHDRSHVVRDEAGVPVRLQGFDQDITERKMAEADREKLEGQLRQSQKMEAIGTLAGGIAHDFNNILYAIQGYAELVLDRLTDQEAREDQQIVLSAAKRASELVKHILAFSRQSQREALPVRVSTVLKEVYRLIRASLPSTIAISQKIEAPDATVMADPTQIHQVLMNLCTNASQAMQETGGELELTLRRCRIGGDGDHEYLRLVPGSYLLLSVRDTGKGIAPEIRDRIFDPFFTTKEVGAGTGLGLSTVHGIVANIGGTVTVYSEPGKGTVFHVYLPLAELAESAHSSDQLVAPPGVERILFIDDEPALVKLGCDVLERLGYKVVGVGSSLDAWESFRADPEAFDLVITDQTMPGLTGGDLAQRMLQLRADMPVILCTGFSHVMTEDKARALGLADFLNKPVSSQDLGLAVRRALDGDRRLVQPVP